MVHVGVDLLRRSSQLAEVLDRSVVVFKHQLTAWAFCIVACDRMNRRRCPDTSGLPHTPMMGTRSDCPPSVP